MLLTQYQLSVICEICCEFFIFQQNNMIVSSLGVHRLYVSISHFSFLTLETPAFI